MYIDVRGSDHFHILYGIMYFVDLGEFGATPVLLSK